MVCCPVLSFSSNFEMLDPYDIKQNNKKVVNNFLYSHEIASTDYLIYGKSL